MINVKKCLKGYKVVDLFAGIGGFHYAFSSFGAEIIYASEWDKDAAEVYEKNFKIKPTGDITKIDAKDIPDHDILCAGIPCQPFSISGKRLGFEDTRGTLFFDVARIVQEKHPKIVFIENVKNFATHDNGNTLGTVLIVMKNLGYNCFWKVLDAANYGVPQKRKRIYIICFRADLGITEFSFPTEEFLTRHVEDILVSEKEVPEKLYINRPDTFFNGSVDNYYSSDSIRLGTINKGGQGERIYSTKGAAVTLSAYGGGAGAKTGLYLVNDRIRRLTPRECARLDGFPEEHKLHENFNVSYKQFGNSVVIDVLQKIIAQFAYNEEMLKCLG